MMMIMTDGPLLLIDMDDANDDNDDDTDSDDDDDFVNF